MFNINFFHIKIDKILFFCRALLGAGLFITTTVLGTVLLVTKGRNYNIGRWCLIFVYPSIWRVCEVGDAHLAFFVYCYRCCGFHEGHYSIHCCLSCDCGSCFRWNGMLSKLLTSAYVLFVIIFYRCT